MRTKPYSHVRHSSRIPGVFGRGLRAGVIDARAGGFGWFEAAGGRRGVPGAMRAILVVLLNLWGLSSAKAAAKDERRRR